MLSGESANRISTIIFELIGASYHEFDDLASGLNSVLLSKDVQRPNWLVFSISPNDEPDLRRSVVVRHLVDEVLDDLKIGLLVQVSSPNGHPFVMTSLGWRHGSAVPILQPHSIYEEERTEPIAITSEQMLHSARILYGHFDASKVKQKLSYHLPAIVSWERLADNKHFAVQLKADVEAVAGKSFHLIHQPLIEANGSGIIADTLRTALPGTANMLEAPRGNYVILTDLLATCDQLAPVVSEIQNAGGSVAAVFSLARYRGIVPSGAPEFKSYAELPYEAFRVPGQCVFCNLDSHPVALTNLADVMGNIDCFDPVTFWELIGSNRAFYSVGHESMSRTRYHYHFRIMVQALFDVHAYGLALRLRNAVRKAQIYPQWVRKIVCPDDEELRRFAGTVAEVFDLNSSDVVFVHRDYLRSVTGRRIDPALTQRIPDSIGSALKGQNVLIIDQAAHHFRTVSSLASICTNYDSIVLAFAVVIDRVDPAVRLAEHLPFSHYVPLYSWPYPPTRPNECPCES